jgi:hypothetical protein
MDGSMVMKMIRTTNHPNGRPFWFMSPDEYHRAEEASEGFCCACGAEASGVEPDARRCRCESCGELKVYGTLALFELGRIEIQTDEGDVEGAILDEQDDPRS